MNERVVKASTVLKEEETKIFSMATGVLKRYRLKIIKGQENVLVFFFFCLTSNKVEQTWAVSSHSKYRACNIKGASGDAKKHKISRNAL